MNEHILFPCMTFLAKLMFEDRDSAAYRLLSLKMSFIIQIFWVFYLKTQYKLLNHKVSSSFGQQIINHLTFV